MRELDAETVPLRGTHLIEASAGCGKTYTITQLYERLVTERGLDVGEILVVTYTRAATAELRDRIRRRLREAAEQEPEGKRKLRLITALRSFDEAAIFTIHGFCRRALAENAFESCVAFDVELVPDLGPLVQEVVYDYWTRELHDAPGLLVSHLMRRAGIRPSRLMGLARRVAADPHLEVLPEPMEVDLDGPERAWREAREVAQRIWKAEGRDVVTLLCEDPGLHKGAYKPERIRDDWVPRIDAMFESPLPGGFGELERLTATGMAARVKKGHTAPSHPFFDACQALFDAEQELLGALEACRVSFERRLVDYARRELARRKDERGAQSYDDLLHSLHAALRSDAGHDLLARLRDRYQAALIDEFQDTDPVQYDIFRRAFRGGDRALFLIGDPKQAIYAFRGADVFAYLDAAADAADERHTLSTNWRSDPALLRAVNTLFGRAREPFLVPEIRFHPVEARPNARDQTTGAPFEILFVPPDDPRVESTRGRVSKDWAERTLPRHIAGEIVRLLTPRNLGTVPRNETSAGKLRDGEPSPSCVRVEPGDIAVLCRTNAQAAAVQAELRALNVPAVLEGDRSVFEQPDAETMERLLVAMANPRDAAAVRAALATPALGVSGDELDRLARDEAAWEERLDRFDRWNRLFREEGFVQAFRRMLDDERVQERLLARPDGERRLTNLLHLGELLHDAAVRGHLGPQALLRWLEQMRRDESARGQLAAEAAQIRLESDARAVRLTTIHKSKGLEYPIVYCPFLWDGRLLSGDDEQHVRFHDARDGRKLKLDLGSESKDAHVAEARREALAENLRLLYVALTRAKHRCSIVWGAFDYRKGQQPALGYLLHQPDGVHDDPVEAARTHLERLGGDGVRAELEALAAASDGSIAVRPLRLDEPEAWTPPAPDARRLEAREFARTVDRRFRISSFSGLVSASDSEAESWQAVVGRDEPPVEAAPDEPVIAPPASIVLRDFPAGAGFGLLLHEIYEHLDFHGATDEDVRALVTRGLARYGYEARFADALCRSVRDVLDTPLDHRGLRLADLPARDRLAEMEFTLPVRGELTPAALADVFARHGAPAADPSYAERLRTLGFDAMHGFLRGFVDLVFVHDGRFYVVDYKSNHLGDAPEQYAPAELSQSMAHHHYYLQYHLYVAALHRHLCSRMPEWDYDEGFGGVFYLFLRGMAPAHAPGTGVFADRPPRALVEDLVTLLDREAAR